MGWLWRGEVRRKLVLRHSLCRYNRNSRFRRPEIDRGSLGNAGLCMRNCFCRWLGCELSDALLDSVRSVGEHHVTQGKRYLMAATIEHGDKHSPRARSVGTARHLHMVAPIYIRFSHHPALTVARVCCPTGPARAPTMATTACPAGQLSLGPHWAMLLWLRPLQ